MAVLRAWVWSTAVAMALLASAPLANAQGQKPSAQTTPASAMGDDSPNPERTGNPIVGVFIIGGAIAFLVLVAWIFSRTGGDTGSRSTDGTLN